MKCPNKSFKSSINQELSDWDLLVNKIGIRNAYKEYIANGEEIPDHNNYTQVGGEVNYLPRIINELISDKTNILYKRFYNNNRDKFYNELIKIVGKDQVSLLKDFNDINNPKSLSDMIIGLLSNYSYSVEINITKTIAEEPKYIDEYEFFNFDGNIYNIGADNDREIFFKNGLEILEKQYKDDFNKAKLSSGKPTQYYSNLTVPGGTNGSYREVNIESPLITLPKSHAQFNTKHTLMFSRMDDAQNYTEKDVEKLLSLMEENGQLKIKCN